jgi:hypothetical protein
MMTGGKTSGLQNLRMIEREREREALGKVGHSLCIHPKKKCWFFAFELELRKRELRVYDMEGFQLLCQ